MTVSNLVREAVVADIPELVRLGGLMYESMGLQLTEEWEARALADIERRLRVDLWGWVIDGEDCLASCALLDRHPRLAPPGEDASWRGYVQWVSTDPEYRRRGYARALMRALMAWADGQSVRVVELHASPVGRGLYDDLGYIPQLGSPMQVDLRNIDLT